MTVRVVTAPRPETRPGLMPSLVFDRPGTPAVEGLYAEVEVDGALFQVSQLPGEWPEWTVDAAFAPGSSCPAFANGFGARYLRTKVLRPEVAAKLEAVRPVRAPTCVGHDLPGGHVCTTLCTTSDCCQEQP